MILLRNNHELLTHKIAICCELSGAENYVILNNISKGNVRAINV